MVVHLALSKSFAANASENARSSLSSTPSSSASTSTSPPAHPNQGPKATQKPKPNPSSKPKTKHVPLKVNVDGKSFATKPAFDVFWQYASERHAVEENRRAGRPQP